MNYLLLRYVIFGTISEKCDARHEHSLFSLLTDLDGYACEYLIDFLHPGSQVLDIGSGSGYLNLTTDSSSLPNDT